MWSWPESGLQEEPLERARLHWGSDTWRGWSVVTYVLTCTFTDSEYILNLRMRWLSFTEFTSFPVNSLRIEALIAIKYACSVTKKEKEKKGGVTRGPGTLLASPRTRDAPHQSTQKNYMKRGETDRETDRQIYKSRLLDQIVRFGENCFQNQFLTLGSTPSRKCMKVKVQVF